MLSCSRISIIIPCFNAQRWIRQALDSVTGQDAGDIEIIAVDDGSTDATADILTEEFPFVKLIRIRNQGPSKARNIGTSLATGEFIQYLDADDLLAEGKLRVQVEMLESSGADVAYGAWGKLTKMENGGYITTEQINRKIQDPEIDLFTDFWCPPAVYLFRRPIVNKIGGWNENLLFIQDARFALDCALHGAKFVYCEGIMAYYRVHSFGSVSTSNALGFTQDCFKNANDIKQWWQEHGDITGVRKKALLEVYGTIARFSFQHDKGMFNKALGILRELTPYYIPPAPLSLKFLSLIFGYKNAEAIALVYRKSKSIFANIAKRLFRGQR